MLDVIQIYKSVEWYEKGDYISEARQQLDHWQDSFSSRTGYLSGGTLNLPVGINTLDFKTTGLVIISDIIGYDPFLVKKQYERSSLPEEMKKDGIDYLLSTNKQYMYFNKLSCQWAFEIFRIERTKKDTYNLFLNYSAKQFEIGIPEREDHKIAELKLDAPVRYRMNGKSDSTLSGRKQRTFTEYDYIIEYLGKAEKVEFIDLNRIEITKKVPASEAKLIDERKILY